MLRSCEDGEGTKQYWYAEVLGVFHVIIQYGTPRVEKRIDLLWVRWMGNDSQYESGFQKRRLARVAYIQENDDTPCYGFVNPELALRGVHVVPAWPYENQTLSKPNPFVYCSKPVIEYASYTVNWYVDHTFTLKISGNIFLLGLQIVTRLCGIVGVEWGIRIFGM